MDDTYCFVQVAFGFSIILFWGDLKQPSGFDSGHWFWGTMLYLAVLLTVLGKAALVSECVHGYRAAATISHTLHIAVFGRSILLQVTTYTPE
jgi:phospholipid-transporting ATPase